MRIILSIVITFFLYNFSFAQVYETKAIIEKGRVYYMTPLVNILSHTINLIRNLITNTVQNLEKQNGKL